MNSTATLSTRQSPNYRFYILTLAAFTFTFVVAIPTMSLPVLFKEISQELNLSLVQVGWIWGIGSVMGVVVGLLGGPIGDRLGPRLTLTIVCLLVGLTGAARGLAWNFSSLAATMFFFGFGQSAIPMNVHKTCGVWFAGPRLGMANGVVSVGMAFGFMLGSLLAASVLSPLLGGWRNVLFVYGAVAVLFGLLWSMTKEKEVDPIHAASPKKHLSISNALKHVTSIRNVWLLSFATLGFASCVNGTLGYLPLYLRDLGWPDASADSALATFHAVSMLCAIPIALFSDRTRIRRGVLMTGALLMTIGVTLMALTHGPLIWLAVIIAGLTRDGFMAITMTTMMEIEGVGARYAGTATGFLLAWLGLGNVISPPLGNSLAALSPNAPFALWATMAGLGFLIYFLIRSNPTPARPG